MRKCPKSHIMMNEVSKLSMHRISFLFTQSGTHSPNACIHHNLIHSPSPVLMLHTYHKTDNEHSETYILVQ